MSGQTIIINSGTPKGGTATELAEEAPSLKKFNITAVIPTVQYGNIQPQYEIEAPTFEEAEEVAMPYIEKLWARYCQAGSELKPREAAAPAKTSKAKFVKMISELTPGQAFFDEASHVYVNEKGKKYLSGSAFCKKYQTPFNREPILKSMEEKYGVPQNEIAEMWRLKGKISTDFGSALHGALEMYGKFFEQGKKTGSGKKPVVNSALHDHPILQKAVEAFYKGREKEEAVYEAFVVNEEKLYCGQLDRVLIVNREKKICRVQDFKTNADINRKGYNKNLLSPFNKMSDTPLSGYWLQLSFYGSLLQDAGWKVEALDVFHHDGEKWITYTHDMIDLSAVI